MNDPLVLQFHRAAGQRISAAQVLAAAGETLDATYLGGYGLECSLKALILSSVPRNQRKHLIEETFRGQAAHNLDRLTSEAIHRGLTIPQPMRKLVRKCVGIWYVELRYRTGRLPGSECKTVLEAAEKIWVWAGGQIQ